MPRYLVTSDLHLTNKNSKFRIGENGVSDLLDAQHEFMSWLVDSHLKTSNCEKFLFLGDYTDSEILDPITLNYATKIMADVTNACSGSIWLEGNHCIDDKGMVNTVMSGLQKLNVPEWHQVITKPTIYTDGYVKFYCVPYNDNYKEAQEVICKYNDELLDEFTNILLFHFPTTNALLDNSFPASRGLSLTDKEVGNFDLVLGGDYHKRQKLLNSSNAYYAGAPFMFTFNEDSNKGFMILDIEGKTIKIEEGHNPFLYEMVKTTQEEFLDLELDNKERAIIQVEGCDEESFKRFSEMRASYYKLSLRKTSNRVEVARKNRPKPLSLEQYVLRSDIDEKDDILDLVKEMTMEA